MTKQCLKQLLKDMTCIIGTKDIVSYFKI